MAYLRMFQQLGEAAEGGGEAEATLVQRNGEEGTHTRDLKEDVVAIL